MVYDLLPDFRVARLLKLFIRGPFYPLTGGSDLEA